MTNRDNDKYPHKVDLTKIARDTMIEEGFDPDIPAAIETELKHLNEEAVIENAPTQDLRHLTWSSLDNSTSRDLDQIEYAERQPDGNIRLLIGIADVDAFVDKDSATDEYASQNTTSVYTGVKTFPMLPEELSTDKTSLLEGQDRLALVIEMHLSENGDVTTRDVYRATVHNYSRCHTKW